MNHSSLTQIIATTQQDLYDHKYKMIFKGTKVRKLKKISNGTQERYSTTEKDALQLFVDYNSFLKGNIVKVIVDHVNISTYTVNSNKHAYLMNRIASIVQV